MQHPKIFNLEERVLKISKLRQRFLEIAEKKGTPCYVYDEEETKKNLQRFQAAFQRQNLNARIFYAVKSNPYPGLLKTVVSEGHGLDVSSQRELKLALAANSKHIIYTGPAKTEDDFLGILPHRDRITIHLESLRELHLLSEIARSKKVRMRCGVRICASAQTGWTKFGIPLGKLREFFEAARTHEESIDFCGVQFHISMNKTPQKYVAALEEIGSYCEAHFSEEERNQFKFLDIGGGFYPEVFEGIYSWNPEQEMKFFDEGNCQNSILADTYVPRYTPIHVSPIEEFAAEIAKTLKANIYPLFKDIALYTEPGRYVSHSSLHILLRLIEIKGYQVGITDGGGNMIGWEKYQFFNYVPLFNLTQFNPEKETPFLLYGSLCTPDDIWGYYLHGNTPRANDLILMPYQGAYTYTLAQEFIHNIPNVQTLRELA